MRLCAAGFTSSQHNARYYESAVGPSFLAKASENQLERNLHFPRWIRLAADYAERRCPQHRAGSSKLRLIQQIENLGSKLQMSSFPNQRVFLALPPSWVKKV